jgi:hypothetical protein
MIAALPFRSWRQAPPERALTIGFIKQTGGVSRKSVCAKVHRKILKVWERQMCNGIADWPKTVDAVPSKERRNQKSKR